MATSYYEWTDTADGHEVMGAVRTGGEVFSGDDFTYSQLQHLVGMSFARPCEPPGQSPEPPSPEPPSPDDDSQLRSEYTRLVALYEAEGWRAIAALAKDYGIEKHEDGWEQTIPELAAAIADAME